MILYLIRIIKKYIKIIPAGLYNGVIWFFSSIPIMINITGFDKTAHIAEYSILGFLLAFGLGVTKSNFEFMARQVLIIGVILGATDEIHQFFVPGRSTDIVDLLADLTGVALGVLIWFILIRLINIPRDTN